MMMMMSPDSMEPDKGTWDWMMESAVADHSSAGRASLRRHALFLRRSPHQQALLDKMLWILQYCEDVCERKRERLLDELKHENKHD